MSPYNNKPTGELRWQPKFGFKEPPNGLPQEWCQLQQEYVWHDDGGAHYEWRDIPIGGISSND